MLYANERPEIERLYRDGMTVHAIAQWLGCKWNEVHRHLIHAGMRRERIADFEPGWWE